ncbi:MAG TPA: hypothetical protein VKT82_21745 [Ktedonobacterales bacterium]|nr:hypothetical protein [Ktedonobacterales bacterium]
MRLFDVYIAVDWSARSVPSPARPTRDALWVAETLAPEIAASDAEVLSGETYWRTRQVCLAYIRTRLRQHIAHNRRVLLGFDFCYGYPAGYAAALGLTGTEPPWRRIWNELDLLIGDNSTNGNNRFAVAATLNERCAGQTPGPLWGCADGVRLSALPARNPGFPYRTRQGHLLEQFRQTERCGSGGQPAWKLYGSGSVGGQTLLGIPAVCGLRDDPEFAAISRVWPFETGFTPTPIPNHGPAILHAEIYPALVSHRLDPTLPIRDQAQVRATARWLGELDTENRLSQLFMAPDHLPTAAIDTCVEEEGWMLGAGMS